MLGALLGIAAAVAYAPTPSSPNTWRDGPPPGPSSVAICPVTAANITIGASTPSVEFRNGQKLFFGSAAAAAAYKASPKDFWLAPHEAPLDGVDGMRGLPDLRHTVLQCALPA